jgi:hypothetical protein
VPKVEQASDASFCLPRSGEPDNQAFAKTTGPEEIPQPPHQSPRLLRQSRPILRKITPRKFRKNQEIQPQVITGCIFPPILAKRIFSRGVTDYFQKYFWVNFEYSLRVPGFFCLSDN